MTDNQQLRRGIAKLQGCRKYEVSGNLWWTKGDTCITCPDCKQQLTVKKSSDPLTDIANVHGYSSHREWITVCGGKANLYDTW